MTTWLPWALAALPLFVLGLTAFNLLFWPRGARRERRRTYSVLIPARDEAATIADAVASAVAEGAHEVIVYDDQSTDGTSEIVARLAAEHDSVRVEQGDGLPEGWVGKPHACHRLSTFASGDVLLFVDADVSLEPGAIERLEGLFDELDADAVTAVPRQETRSLVEHLIVPLLHVTYTSWFPLPLVWRTSDPRFLAANGQVLAVRRDAYDDVGGFEAVRNAVIDDMAFCATLKSSKHRVVFADGHDIARCRMYEDARGVWEGFSKNIYEGLGSGPALVFAVVLYLSAFVAPWVALAVGLLAVPTLVLPAAVGVVANVAQRVGLAIRHSHHPLSVLLHPVGVLLLCAIAINSWMWHARERVVWAGRVYGSKAARNG